MGIEGQEMPDLKNLKEINFKNKLTDIASKQLAASSSFKKPRISQWRKFDDMYNGVVKKKLRVMFNVPLPILSGMLDTLSASYDEPVELEFFKKHPADYFKAKKTQAMWEMEKGSNAKTARWDYKARIDKKTNIRYGRSILKSFAESDPTYRNVLQNTNPYYFHCQPLGGGLLENHLFTGEENIFKSEYDIKMGVENGIYDKNQFKELKSRSSDTEYQRELGMEWEEKMARFRSLGLDPDKDNFVGEKRFNLVEWCLTYRGERWYVLFDPWTKTWLRVEKLSDIFSKNLFPWASWASHEDDAVFWSIGYGDILYPVADSATTLFNQELTNREKKNYNSRMYDKDMVTNVAKLDAAQYRADSLVEIDTKGGSRPIDKAVINFETAELKGTIELIDWVHQAVGKDTGITDIAQGASMQPTKKVNVAYLEQTAVAKRIGYKSQSYTECWGEIGTRYVQGLKDHMSKEQYIEILGEEGIEPDVMTREDLYTKNDLGVRVVSSTSRKAEAQSKKEGRIKANELLQNSQNVNSEMRDAATLRDIGGYSEAEIRIWLDTKNYASRESIAKAHIAIQEILMGDEPDLNFAADVSFVKTIREYAIDHRGKLGVEKFKKFMAYFEANMHFVQDNEVASAKQRGQQNARRQDLAAGMAGKGGAQAGAAGRPQQQPAPEQVQS